MSLFEHPEALRQVGAVLTAMGVAGFVFFRFSRNAPLKRRVWPLFNLLEGALLVAVAALMGFPTSWVVGFVPIVALIMFWTVRETRFCDACGRTLRNQRIFRPSAECPRCGASLTAALEPGAERIRVPRPEPPRVTG